MKYAVIAEGVVENVIDAPEGWKVPGKTLVSADGVAVGPGDLWDGKTFTRPAPTPQPRRLAPYEYRMLFTAAERSAIWQAAVAGDAIIAEALGELQTIITFVDLDNPQTVQYVGYLQMLGLVTSERAAQILAGEAPS